MSLFPRQKPAPVKTPAAKTPAARNRTLRCAAADMAMLDKRLLRLTAPAAVGDIAGRIIHQDIFTAAPLLPEAFADLLILDPPYNLSKNYHGNAFAQKSADAYVAWFEKIIAAVAPALKPAASVYVCADWRTSVVIAPVLERRFHVRNRITWEREKGRGAKANWKNGMEDIWFCTAGGDYHFDVDAVKIKRRVLAPYRANGAPKDWREEKDGNYRLTHPSNLWTDISVPFWSMPENTDHPAQKSEKLLAKLLMASSRENDMVFDPFAGSGSTAVAAKKLRRRFVCVEINHMYCCWAQKRLAAAAPGAAIQGYEDGVFWERNTRHLRRGGRRR